MFLLKLLPAPLHRALYRLAHFARRQVWRLRRPAVKGVRVLAFDSQGRVLLVRHSYGSDKWMPSGGGIKAGEDPVPAAMRELAEETGCTLTGARLVAVIDEDLHGASNEVHIVVGRTESVPRPDRREIVEARFFAIDSLPERMPRGLRGGIGEWIAAWQAYSSES
ncbi:NUDIX domain-containing protein [Novosphingobium mangrovi (ex Huang et al. 2023)]|uniref:NUDIX domain-containing protein n=1 Tax=Novosphingobium mangrovi (ex Huang et al. 2023) TaxID=2976432 RepID=A0ABT2HZS8_9SPHN|nr:NUDIX domain-containing protein [Novosphingobium mangrovi (ex Huang et al. 2023)]MCT2398055.1 NUDIX domain-containing protein [Novosphingobium mangrovi (ex Huang et al. 2023)]